MKKLSLALIALSILAANTALARPAQPKSAVKRARKGDIAAFYTLKSDGNLFRQVGKNSCQITDGVEDIKVSEHPNDRAALYFVKGGDLYILEAAPAGTPTPEQCPPASTRQILTGLARTAKGYRFSLAPVTSPIVVVAMAQDGRFLAWNEQVTAVYLDGAKDFLMNTCFGGKGKSFNSYVAFVIDGTGHVVKLKGDEVGSLKGDMSASYVDVQDFKRKNRVCK